MSSQPITRQAIDHLKSLGFIALRHRPVSPGEYYYKLIWAPSVDPHAPGPNGIELAILLEPNQQGNPCLKCHWIKRAARWNGDLPAAVSFRSWDDVLAPSFEQALAKVVAQARAAVAAEQADIERRRHVKRAQIEAVKAFAEQVRALMGQVVNINKHNLEGTIAEVPAAIHFDEVEGGELAKISHVTVDDVKVGMACNGDPVALAHRVRAFINAVREAAMPWPTTAS